MTIVKSLSTQSIAGLVLTLVGVLFCAFRASLVSALLTCIGVAAVLISVLYAVGKRYVVAGLIAATGITTAVLAWVAVKPALAILGVALIGYSVYTLICSIPKIKYLNAIDKTRLLLTPCVFTAVGIMLTVSCAYLLDGLFIAIGILLILQGLAIYILRLIETLH